MGTPLLNLMVGLIRPASLRFAAALPPLLFHLFHFSPKRFPVAFRNRRRHDFVHQGHEVLQTADPHSRLTVDHRRVLTSASEQNRSAYLFQWDATIVEIGRNRFIGGGK